MITHHPIIRVILTGPESTGKSTLAKQLATHFQTNYVPEYARQYIDELNRPYSYEDILHIAKGQKRQEEQLVQTAHQYLFCDTGILVTKIWCEYVYGKCHDWIIEQLEEQQKQKNAYYLLMDIDIPWIADKQRQNPHDRKELFDRYEQELKTMGAVYHIISGTFEERLNQAIERLNG